MPPCSSEATTLTGSRDGRCATSSTNGGRWSSLSRPRRRWSSLSRPLAALTTATLLTACGPTEQQPDPTPYPPPSLADLERPEPPTLTTDRYTARDAEAYARYLLRELEVGLRSTRMPRVVREVDCEVCERYVRISEEETAARHLLEADDFRILAVVPLEERSAEATRASGHPTYVLDITLSTPRLDVVETDGALVDSYAGGQVETRYTFVGRNGPSPVFWELVD